MKKFYSYFNRLTAIFALLFTFCVSKTWADSSYTIGWGSASGTSGTYSNFTANNGTVTNIVSFSCATNSASNAAAYNSGSSELRLYYKNNGNGNSITLTPASGVTITGVTITASSGYASSAKYSVNGGTATDVSWSTTTSTISGISCTTSFTIQNVSTTAQLRLKKIEITYSSTSGGSGSCNAINVTNGSTVILPAGSTTYTANAWKNAGAPTSYAAAATKKIGTGEYCVSFTQAGDYGSGDGMQLKASSGIVKTEGITSSAGIDVEVVIGSGSGFSIALTGATTLTGKGAGTHTISTTSTTATLTISKTTSGAGYLKTIKISPKCAAPTGLTKGPFFRYHFFYSV